MRMREGGAAVKGCTAREEGQRMDGEVSEDGVGSALLLSAWHQDDCAFPAHMAQTPINQ